MRVMGIETSCDETAVAIVEDSIDISKRVLAHNLFSQIKEHELYGGVVPEIAARAHLEKLDLLIKKTLDDSNLSFKELDGISVTSGPGLIGGVIVGLMFAKSISLVEDLPFIGINHLQGHALSAQIDNDELSYPFLLLLISGGHCQFLVVEAADKFVKLGQTLDDSLGEAFDKTAKMLNLGYPGGVQIERYAKLGAKSRFTLPTPMVGRKGCDFSFSGLKTAVRRELEKIGFDNVTSQDVYDMCASFEDAVLKIVFDRTKNASIEFKKRYSEAKGIVVAGGVAANLAIRNSLRLLSKKQDLEIFFPKLELCTDNGVMIAWAGLKMLQLGYRSSLELAPRPRWHLV